MVEKRTIIERMQDVLTQMVDGKQPVLSGYKPQRPELVGLPDEQRADLHVIQQLERFFDYETIIEQPGTFFRLDGPQYGLRKNTGISQRAPKKITAYHPMAQEFWSEAQMIHDRLNADEQAHTCLLGADIQMRAERKTPNIKTDNASAYILPPVGDIVTAQQFLSVLEQKTRGDAEGAEDKPLIVINRGDFWKHLLWDICGDQYQNNQSHAVTVSTGNGSCKLYIEPSVDMALQRLHQLVPAQHTRPSPPAKPIVPAGSTILVATKTNEKIIELQRIFKDDDVKILRLDHIANFKNPEETSGTFAGNAMEKITNGREAFAQMLARDPLAMRTMLKTNGIDASKLFLMAEDSGLYLDNPDILEYMDLKKLGVPEGISFHNMHFPGVEFGPIISGLLGEKSFWDEVNHALDTLENKVKQEQADGGNKRVSSRGVINPSVLALTPLSVENSHQHHAPVYFFSGTGQATVERAIRPADVEVPYTGNYLVPSSQGLMAHEGRLASAMQTQAELGDDYLARLSPRSSAAEVLKQSCNVKAREPLKANKVTSAQPFHVAALSDEANDKTGLNFATQSQPLSTLNRWDKGGALAASLEQTLAEHDAFILMPHARDKAAQDAHLFSDLFNFFSVIVAKQLTPRDKDKPFIVYNKDQCWQPMLELYNDMRRVAMANDQQGTFIKVTDDPKTIEETVAIAHKNNFKGLYPPAQHDAMHIPDSGRFNVAVFCSATAKNQHLKNDAKALGEYLGSHHYGTVYGAADREMMGAVRDGVLMAKARGYDTWIAGSSTDDILQVESKNPQAVVKSLDHYFNARHIYERMEYMLQTADAFTVIPGGAGTVQELAAVLMLKEAGHPAVQGKDVVIYNQRLQFDETHSSSKGFYDRLLTMIPPERRDALGIHVCQSREEVEHTLDNLRARSSKKLPDVPAAKITTVTGGERCGELGCAPAI